MLWWLAIGAIVFMSLVMVAAAYGFESGVHPKH